LIRLEGVSFSYRSGSKETKALNEVSLEIPRGEFVAVVGGNGSGKSTLAKHLNALLLPSEGVVTVDGNDTREPDNLWRIRQLVGMVFQNPDNQIVASVIEEDVAFGPENLGLPPAEIRARVDAALRAVGLSELNLRPPHLLSGGQKQRVAIAGILAMQPEILVLDEPTTMLDPRGRDEVVKTVLELRSNLGLTVIYITHLMEEAALADRILIMDAGRLVADGPPRAILTKPDLLRQMGLDVSEMTRLAGMLRQRGLPVPADIISVPEMVDCLCPLL